MELRLTHGALALTLAAGCVPSAYTVDQAGIVPAPRALPYDGQPLSAPARVEGRYTRIVEPVEAEGDARSGAYVARHHTGIALRRGHGDTDIGMAVDVGWSEDAAPTAEGIGRPPEGTGPWSMVGDVRHSLAVNERIRVGIGLGMGFVSVPVRLDGGSVERDEAAIFQAAVVPSWRSGPLTAFAGVTLTTEVAVPRTIVVTEDSDVPDVRGDRGAIVVSAGGTYALDGGLRLTAQVSRPVDSDLTDELQLDLGLGFDFGGGAAAQASTGAPLGAGAGGAPGATP